MSVLNMNPTHLEFYATLGYAITQWAHVEEALYQVYWVGMGQPDNLTANASFYSIINFNAKASMVDSVMTVRYAHMPEILARWRNVYNRLIKRAKDRNDLAHFQVVGALDKGKMALSLVPHLFNPKRDPAFSGKQEVPSYRVADIRDCEAKFYGCWEELNSLFHDLRGEEAILAESPPPRDDPPRPRRRDSQKHAEP